MKAPPKTRPIYYQALLFCIYLVGCIFALGEELSGRADVFTHLVCVAFVGCTLVCILGAFGVRKARFVGLCLLPLFAPAIFCEANESFGSWPLALGVTVLAIAWIMAEWAGAFLIPDEEKKPPEGE
jgi:hypothetical protein